MTLSGTVKPTIAAGQAADAAGNTNTASTSTDNTVTYNDTTAPILTITSFTKSGTTVTVSGTGGTTPGDNSTITIVICTTLNGTQCNNPQTVVTLTASRDGITGAWTATSAALGTQPTLYARVTQTDLAGNVGSASAGPISTP